MASKERGLICTGQSVRAFLADRKSQTRRVLKPQPNYMKRHGETEKEMLANIARRKCPYGKVGDKIYVREKLINWSESERFVNGAYYADETKVIPNDGRVNTWGWKTNTLSPRFMPKWATRIWREIAGIRLEILKEISDDDIICEGFKTREEFYETIIKINQAKNPEEFLGKWVWVLDLQIQEGGK